MAAVAPLRFTLEGQMPSGKNQVKTAFVHGRVMRFPNARFKAWKAKAYKELTAARGEWATLREPGSVAVKYTPGDRLRRDVPGIIDALCNLLEHCPVCRKKNKTCVIPVVQDDSLLVNWDWETMPLDRLHPRIEVSIQALIL